MEDHLNLYLVWPFIFSLLSRCELFFNHKICLQNKTFSPSLYRKISPSGLPRRNCQGHGHVGTCPWREVHKVITLTSFCEKMWKHTHNEAFCLDKLAPGMNEESLGWRLPCEWVLIKLCFQLQTLDKGNITDYSDFKLFSWLKKKNKKTPQFYSIEPESQWKLSWILFFRIFKTVVLCTIQCTRQTLKIYVHLS